MTLAQTALRDLLARVSTERGRMGALSAMNEQTDETRAEMKTLQGGADELESRIRSARLAVEHEGQGVTKPAPDSEMRERIELRSKASLGNYLLARARGVLVSGAEAELASAAGVDGIPLELWDNESDEKRVVADPPGTVGVNLQNIVPAVFSSSIASRLGIDMPRSPSGSFASATITTSQTAAAKAKSADAVGAAGAMTVTTATAKRISARLELTIEDIAASGAANFEPALRQNLSLALSSELDNQAINGNGTAPNLSGIFKSLGSAASATTAIAAFDDFAAVHAGGVDGLWANSLKDVRIVCGTEAYVLASKTFQSATNYKGEMSAAAYAIANTGGLWTNSRMPSKTSHVEQALLYRMGQSMMPRRVRTAVCPHWGVINIDDVYSGSARGERYFSMHVLLGNVIVVQTGAYSRIAYRVSS